MTTTWVPVPDDDAEDLLGEGVHTGLRKGTDASGSSAAWRAINADDSGWSDAIRFAVSGLAYMGFRVCQAKPDCDPETCPAGAHDDANGEWPPDLCRNCHRPYTDKEGCK